MLRRVPLIVATCALIAAVAAAPAVVAAPKAEHRAQSPARPAVGSRMTFGTPTIVDTVHTFGEPDIKVAPNGDIHDSGPWGTGTQRSMWLQSTDKGATFHSMHSQPVSSPGDSDTFIPGPGGGDTEISIDHNNKVYYADLAALEELKVATWNRATHTMQTGVLQTPQSLTNGIDRQWFAMWDPPTPPAGYTGPLPVNYLSFAAATAGSSCTPPVLGSCEVLEYSTDGITYSNPTAAAPISSDGPLVIDQQTGTVFEAIALGGNDVGVGIYTRDVSNAATDPSLTHVQEVKIADLPGGADVGALFPVPAIDSARNVYVIWVAENTDKTVKQDATQWQIYYSYATAASNWTNWSAPVQLSSAPSNTNIMPWAVAGSDGRLAAVWYGTADSTHNPSSDDVHQPWNVYLANVTNAASPSPTIQQIRVTRHPMHYGSICLAGTGCAAQNPPGNRNLADFFEDTVDPNTGALVITYDDTSNNLKQHDPTGSSTPPEQVAHTGAPQVVMVRQNGGIGMLGTPVHGPPALRHGMGDKRKDATFDPIYSTKNIPQLDVRGLRVARTKKNLVIKITSSTLNNLSKAINATGASDLDWVARWDGPATKKAPGTAGLSNPIYYAAVESDGSAAPSFFAGIARSVELCSVSGCFPHVLEYPEPPYAGTAIKGKLVRTKGPKPDYWVLKVPFSVIGSPGPAKLLEDFGAYVFARNKPASVPMTNAEGQGGVTPIMVDGVCCFDYRVPK